MSEITLGAIIGTLVILGAISFFIATMLNDEQLGRIFIRTRAKIGLLRLFFGFLTIFIKIFILAIFAIIYINRENFDIINFVITYGVTTLVLVLVLFVIYFLKTTLKKQVGDRVD